MWVGEKQTHHNEEASKPKEMNEANLLEGFMAAFNVKPKAK